ncbi:MAG TPA: ISL3 family transposase [Candidatus Dormibacteraeota bacterium]|nr:ISL3 family transposase [Candidatus Dormibacteraeota bacterium]
MQDRELYRRILGIEAPWQVERVELKLEAGEIHVYLEHAGDVSWACAECSAPSPLYDHQSERCWRHLDTCQYQTILHASPPRTNCKEHGVKVVALPWAEAGARFTALFEALAIAWLKAASQKAVAAQLALSWDEIHSIMERAVKRGLKRRQVEPIVHLGVDEKAFRKGHSYLTVVNDLARSRVLHVAEGRQQSSLDGFWATVNEDQKAGIEAVAMDMWDPYIDSVRAHLPAAEQKIVFDKFHIAKHLGEAVDQVRRKEHKALKAEGDERLTGTKYHWLRNPAAMNRKQKRTLVQLRNSELKTARAWALKETAMALYNYVYEKPARKHFQWWYSWAVRSRLEPMKKIAGMLKRRFENIITYLAHPITNATSESLNAKIQWVKYTARGFRNKQNFINAIYFHCGGLDLDPSPTK